MHKSQNPKVKENYSTGIRKCFASELKKIDKTVKETLKQAVEFAENSPEPDLAEIYTDVLANN